MTSIITINVFIDHISRLRCDIFLTTLWAALVPFVIITSLGVGENFGGGHMIYRGNGGGTVVANRV